MSRSQAAARIRKSAQEAKTFPTGNSKSSATRIRKTADARPPVQQRYLDRRQAAAYLGFSVEKLIDLIQAKAIAEYSFGHACKRYRLEDLDAFAEARRTEAKVAA